MIDEKAATRYMVVWPLQFEQEGQSALLVREGGLDARLPEIDFIKLLTRQEIKPLAICSTDPEFHTGHSRRN